MHHHCATVIPWPFPSPSRRHPDSFALMLVNSTLIFLGYRKICIDRAEGLVYACIHSTNLKMEARFLSPQTRDAVVGSLSARSLRHNILYSSPIGCFEMIQLRVRAVVQGNGTPVSINHDLFDRLSPLQACLPYWSRLTHYAIYNARN